MQTLGTTIEVAAVLFDMDGVLVDSRASIERAWRAWAMRAGVPAERVLATVPGRIGRDIVAGLRPDLDPLAEAAWVEAYERDDVAGVVATPGAAEILVGLPEDRWAVVTSAPRAVAIARLAAGGLPAPSVLVTAGDVPRGKPAPDGYRMAAATLAVDAASCLVVEDAPAGVVAGVAAGTRVLALSTTHPAAALGGAWRVVPDLGAARASVTPRGLELTISDAGDRGG